MSDLGQNIAVAAFAATVGIPLMHRVTPRSVGPGTKKAGPNRARLA